MRLRTIGLISTLALGLLSGPLPAEAQQAGKVYRIGILRSGSPSSKLYASQHKILRQDLRELEYMEGKNLLIEYRYAESKPKRLPDLAADLVRLKVDVIVTSPGPPAVRAAQRATRTVPIVIPGTNLDPVKAGYVVSLARPGGNITGLTNFDSRLHGKRLELLKKAFPNISRVVILWPVRQQKAAGKEIEIVRKALGIQIQTVVASRRIEGIESTFSAISRAHPDGLLVASARSTLAHRGRIIDFAAKRRLPTMYARSRFVKEGGLMSYGANNADLWHRAATYVAKILKGAKPADLPVEQPRKFDLVINLKTAKQLGITIPPEVLYQATKVIK